MAENEIPQGANNGGVIIDWIVRVSNIIRKIGLQNLLITIMVLFLVIIVGQIAFNPSILIKKMDEVQQRMHTESVMKRIKAEPEIRESLINIREELNADRVYILETHNGGNNLSGLPFLYVDLTYAEPKSSMSWMEDEYKNVRLSRYPWASYMFNETYWFGSIDDIQKVDMELYYRLEKEGVKYMGMIVMYGTYNPCGVLGVVYDETAEIPSQELVKKELMRYSSSISTLLNNE